MSRFLGQQTRRLGPLFVWIGALAVVLQGPDYAFAQCALCRDAVASSSPATREAMNYAIIGLALTPYGVVALAVWALSPSVRSYVRATLKRLIRRRTGGKL